MLLLLCFCFFYLSNIGVGISFSDSPNTAKLTDCEQCKLFVKSFQHWLDKTSRGKYEGGDAAWEENKLKAYARSEVRLVEIQEGLCSELKKNKDQCYALAADIEEIVEQWWFNENSESTDLKSWLCIDKLSHCCPSGHYGEECKPCPANKTSICNGNGKCDGDGSRIGNGSCVCNRGYQGQLCDECSKDFFRDTANKCSECHFACSGCFSAGDSGCIACKKGYQRYIDECIDIDECLENPCKEKHYCVNLAGSYECNACYPSCKNCLGPHPDNCTECVEKNTLFRTSCIDETTKERIWLRSIHKLLMYVGFIVMLLFIAKNFKVISSICAVVLAVYIYYSECENPDMTNLLELIKSS